MPPDLHPDLHSKECNMLIAAMQKCYAERSYMKYLGACTEEYYAVSNCLSKERSAQLAKAGERHNKQLEQRAKNKIKTQENIETQQESLQNTK